MTAEVQERHPMAAGKVATRTDREAVHAHFHPGSPLPPDGSAYAKWIADGGNVVHMPLGGQNRWPFYEENKLANLLATVRADAEERGRIEERVRCAEAASNVDVTSDWTIRRWRETFSKITCASIEAIEAWEDSDDTIKSLVLDAARKELGE